MNGQHTKRTVAKFLKTETARAAAEYSGFSRLGDFSADDNEQVTLRFRGDYVLSEVRALLADLDRVQMAYNTWKDARCPHCGKATGIDGNGESLRDDCIGAGVGF